MADDQLGVNQACRLLGISKDSYYHSQNPDSSLTTKYHHLKPMVEQIIRVNPAYGYPRIKVALYRQFGETVNHKLLLKLLKVWGLSLHRQLPKRRSNWMTKVLKYLQITG